MINWIFGELEKEQGHEQYLENSRSPLENKYILSSGKNGDSTLYHSERTFIWEMN